MNWQKEAESDLRNYIKRKESLDNIKERVRALQDEICSIKSASCDSVPIQGGGNRMEDSLINNIVKRKRLALAYRATSRLVLLTERGLESLTERERMVLEKFYIRRIPNHVGWLMDELVIEQSQVYRIKDDALYNFTVAMFGIIDY